MTCQEILDLIRSNQSELASKGVESLAIFGSIARGEANIDSDVDMLVSFNQAIGLFDFIRVKLYLENLIGRSVDLVTADALRTEMRDDILAEAIYAN